MNRKIVFLLAVVVAFISMMSCKPKQSNYKSTYEIAKENEKKDEVIEEVAYVVEEEDVVSSENMNTSVRKETITPVVDRDESKIKKYSVVIASMGMKPNAESLQERLQDTGYETIIVQNSQGMYRVIIAGAVSKEGAINERSTILSEFKKQGTNEQLRKKYGIPFNDWWILERQ